MHFPAFEHVNVFPCWWNKRLMYIPPWFTRCRTPTNVIFVEKAVSYFGLYSFPLSGGELYILRRPKRQPVKVQAK